ncbi:MAG: beta-galactosidase, partial [Tannerellaceae bacterium]|nr:beta-galactosidase [Tannerellaceae bacterium]
PLSTLEGVKNTVISLDGTWQFRFSANGKWENVQVPGELAMQGYGIEHDTPYTYRKDFQVPADYKGKRTILRFDGVYSYARLSVNGKFVREHRGGFTRWETDITGFITPGKSNRIELEVIDPLNDISYASGYAHHPVGGILRSVTLLAQPEATLCNFFIETHLDNQYRYATLHIGAIPVGNYQDMELAFALTDPQGHEVSLPAGNIPITELVAKRTISFPILAPQKWDAEHPRLYHLMVKGYKNGKEIMRFTRPVGFRTIEITGDRMLVNGSPVKLRGACRHDIHPTLGRTTTPELDSLDVMLFKQSNMNFVRTSHYPPSEKFVELCDRYGIYVECETAVCFVGSHRQKNYNPGNSESDPAYTDQYLSQCREMVNTFRSSPSVVIWSIGNESYEGTNFRKSWDLIKEADSTRPVIFSYPGLVKSDFKIYDLLSMHYQDVNGDLEQYGMHTHRFRGHGIPALFDEWAHPACYTYATLQEDPNIREFWGISLDKMWSGLFDAPGGLGGAIWGYVDETFALPQPKRGTSYWIDFAHTAKPENVKGNCVGYGEWGIVDVWRRLKPEFWSTRKAYSPVRLLETRINNFIPDEKLLLPVYNRYDHTSLDELTLRYTFNKTTREIALPAITPHSKGLIQLPAAPWKHGSELFVEFIDANKEVVDCYLLPIGKPEADTYTGKRTGKLNVTDQPDLLIIKGNNFEIPFNKHTGLIRNATSDGQIIIEEGPFVYLDINLNHLTGAEVRKSANKYQTFANDWKKKSISYEQVGENIQVQVTGTYHEVAVDLTITVSPQGKMDIQYFTSGEPNGYLRETGITFRLPQTYENLSWKRKGYWDYYPENDFAGNTGFTPLYQSRQAAYGKEPVQPWWNDTHEYYYWADRGTNCAQPLTRMAKGMKENIYSYRLGKTGNKSDLSIVSPDATLACRLSKQPNDELYLYINTRWDYPEIAWGNYCKTLEATPCYGMISILF